MNQEKPIHFYVANLGSEIQRVLEWKEKDDKKSMQNAYKRALSIIDTIKNFGNRNANLEMGILQETINNMIANDDRCKVNRDQISAYFNPFALRMLNQ